MKIGIYNIKPRYTVLRLITDLTAAGFLYLIGQTAYTFIIDSIHFNESLFKSTENAEAAKLSWFPLLTFPSLAVLLTVLTLVYTFKSRKTPKKYTITKSTALKYYDITVMAAGLIRIVALLGLFDLTYIHGTIIMKRGGSLLSMQVICDIILIIIIVRFTSYRIFVMSKAEEKKKKENRHIIEN